MKPNMTGLNHTGFGRSSRATLGSRAFAGRFALAGFSDFLLSLISDMVQFYALATPS